MFCYRCNKKGHITSNCDIKRNEYRKLLNTDENKIYIRNLSYKDSYCCIIL